MESGTECILKTEQNPPPKIQIYPTSTDQISPFLREKYEREAKKHWDIFYKHHRDKFFKDRHYLDKEWGQYFTEAERKAVLEVGCGAGNTVFPLIAQYSDIFVHACDFSPRAIELVKKHKEFTEARVNAFVCDLTIDDLCKNIPPSSVDIVTLIFVLSAVSPEKMPLVLQNIKKVLKRNGRVLFRDYATGDLAQERFISKDQKISENFYVRGDGTRAFYFSEEFLKNLFSSNGFYTQEYGVCCKQVENRSRDIVMNRRWVQAAFSLNNADNSLPSKQIETKGLKEMENGLEVDLSDGVVAAEMFNISPPADEIMEYRFDDCSFKMKGLPKEYQHTCKSTGLMLWESAGLMASILASNKSIVKGKRVLELGCGCSGICSMISAASADLVVATDGDEKSLTLLTQNIAINPQHSSQKLAVKKLQWGKKDEILSIKKLIPDGTGFDVVLGTDVTYVPEAVLPLFETARDLLSLSDNVAVNPVLILCHVLRRVQEELIFSAAAKYGFILVDRWPRMMTSAGQYEYEEGDDISVIDGWISRINLKEEDFIPSTALSILYFHRVA